jgi:hypothetical protein
MEQVTRHTQHSVDNVSLLHGSAFSFADTITTEGDGTQGLARNKLKKKDRSQGLSSASGPDQGLLGDINHGEELGGRSGSHRGLFWWTPEILVLMGGLSCLIGLYDGLCDPLGRHPIT